MTLKLLVIDDSTNIQKIVGLAFGDEDAIVESVSNGEVALSVVRDFRPDVVLVDVFMPGCSGYEICAGIKEDPELSDIAVVLLVGTFEPFDESEASRAKCDGFLTKPFNTSDLLQTVRSLEESRRQKRQDDAGWDDAAMGTQNTAAGEVESSRFRLHSLASPEARDSFLGSDRILDLFDNDQLSIAKAAIAASIRRSETQTAQGAASPGPADTVDVLFSESTLNRIVDTVIRRMSAEAIREVAWEVVPELSESIIRRTIEEQDKA